MIGEGQIRDPEQ